jgi:hypothetical protein
MPQLFFQQFSGISHNVWLFTTLAAAYKGLRSKTAAANVPE